MEEGREEQKKSDRRKGKRSRGQTSDIRHQTSDIRQAGAGTRDDNKQKEMIIVTTHSSFFLRTARCADRTVLTRELLFWPAIAGACAASYYCYCYRYRYRYRYRCYHHRH